MIETLMRPAILALIFTLGCMILYQFIRPKLPYEVNPKLPKLPVVGARKGEWFAMRKAMWRNSKDIRSATAEAYQYKDEACLFPILDMNAVVILPPKEVPWFHEQPDSELSAHFHQLNAFQLNYTITDPRLVEDIQPIHQVLINTTLTRETNNLLPALAEEITSSVDELWGTDTQQHKEFFLMDDMPEIVGRVVNRAFVGPGLCQSKDLVNNGVGFARGLGFTSVLLRCTPQWLRPFAGFFLTLPQKIATWRFYRALRPEVNRRIRSMFAKPSENEKSKPKHNDFLQWTIDAAIESRNPYMMKPDTIMGRVLLLNFVSIHTSTFAITHALLDLASNDPAYIDELRTEIVTALQSHGGEWSKRTLSDMPKLDSMFRESQRMSSIVTVASPKPVMNPNGITTPSGLHLPYGAYLAILSHPILHDASIYPDPETFKPFRFSEKRDAADEQGLKLEKARQSWISVTKTYTAFGTGRHACPGRFFAANMLKVLLAYILLNYDLEKIRKRPVNPTFSVSLFPPLNASIRFKRRENPLFSFVNKSAR